jgi:type IX secretion system PorP/SprF family membrane protein
MIFQSRNYFLLKIVGYFLFCTPLSSWAQDPSFAQFYNIRSYLNPALIGLQNGTTINAAFREHWVKLPGSFRTGYIAAEARVPLIKSSIGFTFMQDVAGSTALKEQRGSFIFNYQGIHFPRTKLFPDLRLYGAVEFGVNRQYIDFANLLFPDQLDPVFGISRPTAATAIVQDVYSFDIGAGSSWIGDLQIGKTLVHFLLGGSFHNYSFVRGGEGLSNTDPKAVTPLRFTAHGAAEIPLQRISDGQVRPRHFSLGMHWRVDAQGRFWNSSIGSFLIYERRVYAGLLYQNRFYTIDNKNTNNLDFVVGYKMAMGKDQTMDLAFGYGAFGTGLSMRAGGSYELTMNYNFSNAFLFKDKGRDPNRFNKCWTFF